MKQDCIDNNADPASAQTSICPVGESSCVIIDEVLSLRTENRKLSKLVRTDTLTGLYNFHHFSKSLEQEMERSRRTLLPTGLVFVDLDFFKKVNDTWGHEVGNLALIQTAELIRRLVRKIDIPCRYGGEEFAIILPATDLNTSAQVAERLRLAIEEKPLINGEHTIQLTASLGVDIFKGHEGDTAQMFIKRADSFLYQAKNEGRNRVCIASYERKEPLSQVSHEEKDLLFGLFSEQNDSE